MCVPVSPCSALFKRINMLALQQMTAPTHCASNDDNNNSCLSPSALKALNKPKSGLRRCLFGVPKAEDNAKIIEEDREANRARMAKLWSWDVTEDAPATSGSWLWEKVKRTTPTLAPLARKSFMPVSEYRHHPYPGAVRVERASSGDSSATVNFQVPAMISPIPPTPVFSRVRRTSTSSASSASSDEDEIESSETSTLSPPSSSSETWSPSFTAQISCSVKVQTRLTDFWRSRRSSCSDSRHVKSPALTIQKNIRPGEMACSV